MRKVLVSSGFLLLLMFLRGCEMASTPQKTSVGLSMLKEKYEGEDNNFKDMKTRVPGVLLDTPISCLGMAGEGIAGYGAHLSVVCIKLPDGTEVIGIVPTSEGFKKDVEISGQIVFISAGVLEKGWSFLPP